MLSFRLLNPSKWLAPLLGVLLAACSTEPASSAERSPFTGPAAVASSALVGNDGAYTVSTAGDILNTYAALAANAAVGATSIQVTTIANLNSTKFGNLAAGDLLMII